jgi:hypothetical protein
MHALFGLSPFMVRLWVLRLPRGLACLLRLILCSASFSLARVNNQWGDRQ